MRFNSQILTTVLIRTAILWSMVIFISFDLRRCFLRSYPLLSFTPNATGRRWVNRVARIFLRWKKIPITHYSQIFLPFFLPSPPHHTTSTSSPSLLASVYKCHLAIITKDPILGPRHPKPRSYLLKFPGVQSLTPIGGQANLTVWKRSHPLNQKRSCCQTRI
jgi:hypothetical protein